MEHALNKVSKESVANEHAPCSSPARGKLSKARVFLMLLGLVIIPAIVIPNVLEARKHGNEASAIGSMRDLNKAQTLYIEKSPSQQYGTLKDLEQGGYIDSDLGSGQRNGYVFEVVLDAANPHYEYRAWAHPLMYDVTGNRYFFTNQRGVIRFNSGAIADEQSASS